MRSKYRSIRDNVNYRVLLQQFRAEEPDVTRHLFVPIRDNIERKLEWVLDAPTALKCCVLMG